jgi:NAD(P)-dependent dehydrogenase (short-subunit alcohol dehydrogenase family)
VVTGGLSGIGRAIAELYDEQDAHVAIFDILDRSHDDEMLAGDFVRHLQHDALFVRGDVSQPDEVGRLFTAAVQRFGRIDILVNNAGINVFEPVVSMTVEDFDRLMSVNVRGTFLSCQQAIRQMLTQGGRGVIVNVASNFGLVGAPEVVA